MYEIAIAKVFAQYPQYFGIFSSCNNNFKIIESNKTTDHRRCGICPKCAFVYTTLRPFISDENTQNIFGQELYNTLSLIPLYRELLGIDGIKPFECVGTNFKNEVLPKLSPSDLLILEKKLFTSYNEETNIPRIFQNILSL